MKVLIIANARYKDGLSGSDAIYLNFKKYWPCHIDTWEMMWMDFKPFWLCYGMRIIFSIIKAAFCFKRYDFVYSASDFMMDSLPGFIMKLKGNKWIAGIYLYAIRKNKIHYLTQKKIIRILKKYADIVSITNNSMKHGFYNKPMVEINGGVDLNFCGESSQPKLYDAVFCGRIHKSKGIDEMIEIWGMVRDKNPNARLAVIGDGDLGTGYIEKKALSRFGNLNGIVLFGFMGNERYDIYKKSKVVIYPSTEDHFSMAPVEAMACGCPMIAFNLNVMEYIKPKGTFIVRDNKEFSATILDLISGNGRYASKRKEAVLWAKQFDYKSQSLRVFKEIKSLL